jgi:hypothetical protein
MSSRIVDVITSGVVERVAYHEAGHVAIGGTLSGQFF